MCPFIAELDFAVIVIFLSGCIGRYIEPWSPHPPLMVGVGFVYILARIAVHIVVSKLRTRKEAT